MIGELRLKVDGMQKELHTQNKRLEEGASFAEHFHNDLRVAVQVLESAKHYEVVFYLAPEYGVDGLEDSSEASVRCYPLLHVAMG